MKNNKGGEGDPGPNNGGGLVKELKALIKKHKGDPHRGKILPELAALTKKHTHANLLTGLGRITKGEGDPGPNNGKGLIKEIEALVGKHQKAGPHRHTMLPELAALTASHGHAHTLDGLRSLTNGEGDPGPNNGGGLTKELVALIDKHNTNGGPHRQAILPDLAGLLEKHTREQALSGLHQAIHGEGDPGPNNGGGVIKDLISLIDKNNGGSGPHRGDMLPGLAALVEKHTNEQLVLDLWKLMPSIPFDLPQQLQTEWCWLAVAVGVASYWDRYVAKIDRVPTQCDLASTLLGGPSQTLHCCVDGSSTACDSGGHVNEALVKLGIDAVREKGEMTFEKIREKLVDKLPVIARIGWSDANGRVEPNGLGHVIVIHGCSGSTGQRTLAVLDPVLPDSFFLDYEAVVSHYLRKGKWTHTIYLEKPKP